MESRTKNPEPTSTFRLLKIKPMSINAAWQGRRFRTKDYKNYQRQLETLLGWSDKLEGFVVIQLVFTLPRVVFGKCDVDNFVKPILDCIVNKGLIEDDRKVIKLTAEKKLGDDFSVGILINKVTNLDL